MLQFALTGRLPAGMGFAGRHGERKETDTKVPLKMTGSGGESQQCQICGHSPAADVCPTCGVEAARLYEVMGGPKIAIRSRKKGTLLTGTSDEERSSELVWSLMAPEFRRRLAEQYGKLAVQINCIKAAVLVPACLVGFLGLFGAVLWVTGRLIPGRITSVDWLVAAVLIFLVLPFAYRIAGRVEDTIQRRSLGGAESDLLCAADIVLPALRKRLRQPWPLRNGVWLSINLAVTIAAWYAAVTWLL